MLMALLKRRDAHKLLNGGIECPGDLDEQQECNLVICALDPSQMTPVNTSE